MAKNKPTLPKDTNQLAKRIVDIATSEKAEKKNNSKVTGEKKKGNSKH